MPDIAPASVHVVELTDTDRAAQSLLIITAGSATAKAPSCAGLLLHFDRARVVQVGSAHEVESLGVELKADSYDTVVIDGPVLGPAVRDAAASRAAESLRTGGRIVVLMDPDPELPPEASEAPPEPRSAPTVSLAELTWEGVATLAGMPCAVLGRRADAPGAADDADDDQHGTPVDVAARLATMEQTLAARQAYDSATGGGQEGGSRAKRHDSEAALLAHLRTAVQEQAAEQRRREQADQRREDLEKRYTSLERQHTRLRTSKLGLVMARYWQFRKRVRRTLGG
ncbi:MAG TPA: hypothetical protein VE287_13495 [Actinopolymorphaceae bacterium]|nr:hypothetical protein [Actinopolymorphaceae bacterium]